MSDRPTNLMNWYYGKEPKQAAKELWSEWTSGRTEAWDTPLQGALTIFTSAMLLQEKGSLNLDEQCGREFAEALGKALLIVSMSEDPEVPLYPFEDRESEELYFKVLEHLKAMASGPTRGPRAEVGAMVEKTTYIAMAPERGKMRILRKSEKFTEARSSARKAVKGKRYPNATVLKVEPFSSRVVLKVTPGRELDWRKPVSR